MNELINALMNELGKQNERLSEYRKTIKNQIIDC